jgi:hypothetical protein
MCLPECRPDWPKQQMPRTAPNGRGPGVDSTSARTPSKQPQAAPNKTKQKPLVSLDFIRQNRFFSMVTAEKIKKILSATSGCTPAPEPFPRLSSSGAPAVQVTD